MRAFAADVFEGAIHNRVNVVVFEIDVMVRGVREHMRAVRYRFATLQEQRALANILNDPSTDATTALQDTENGRALQPRRKAA